jgi:hypothetical protein
MRFDMLQDPRLHYNDYTPKPRFLFKLNTSRRYAYIDFLGKATI